MANYRGVQPSEISDIGSSLKTGEKPWALLRERPQIIIRFCTIKTYSSTFQSYHNTIETYCGTFIHRTFVKRISFLPTENVLLYDLCTFGIRLWYLWYTIWVRLVYDYGTFGIRLSYLWYTIMVRLVYDSRTFGIRLWYLSYTFDVRLPYVYINHFCVRFTWGNVSKLPITCIV